MYVTYLWFAVGFVHIVSEKPLPYELIDNNQSVWWVPTGDDDA